MSKGPEVDGVLVQWGERLFYPRNRIARSAPVPRLAGSVGARAAAIRQRIHATVVRRASQVMVKVTGGGRGMAAIAAHLRYISKAGRLPFEDDRGVVREGREALHDLTEQWRHGGTFIPETSPRREAFNIMLSMPSGTDPLIVQRAAREFAQAELRDHRYVMVPHDHQANPHVHISVRAESREGKRLNPRKVDLQRWRETFAEKLRGWGVDAEASRQHARGPVRHYEPIWRVKAAEEGRLRTPRRTAGSGAGSMSHRALASEAWRRIAEALSRSDRPDDKALAGHVERFLSDSFGIPSKPVLDRNAGGPDWESREAPQPSRALAKDRGGQGIQR
jgi:hypothetical protein